MWAKYVAYILLGLCLVGLLVFIRRDAGRLGGPHRWWRRNTARRRGHRAGAGPYDGSWWLFWLDSGSYAAGGGDPGGGTDASGTDGGSDAGGGGSDG